MPTTRLMQFSSSGGSVQITTDGEAQNTRPLPGVSSMHFLRLMEDKGHVGFWTLDFATGHITTSMGLYHVLGLDPSHPCGGDDLFKMMHPDDRVAQYDTLELLRSGQPINREFRLLRPDGTMRWIQNKGEVVFGAEGRPTCAVGLMLDITDQHEARKSVEEGWYRYKTLVSAMASMECKVAANGDVLMWANWEKLTGQTPAELAGWGWLDAVHPDDRERTRSQWRQSVLNRTAYASDFRVLGKDGVFRWFLARVAPVFNANEEIRAWIGALVGMVSGSVSTGDFRDGTAQGLLPTHIRAARALLDWTIEDLALKAKVSVSSIRRLEKEEGNTVRTPVHRAVRAALEAGGVCFSAGQNGEIILRYIKP